MCRYSDLIRLRLGEAIEEETVVVDGDESRAADGVRSKAAPQIFSEDVV